MSQIKRVDMDHQKVLEAWKKLCAEHKAYFEKFVLATKRADQMLAIKAPSGRLKYGQDCADSYVIGDWCQEFWFALPDTPDTRTLAFFMVCDVAEWFMDGDDE